MFNNIIELETESAKSFNYLQYAVTVFSDWHVLCEYKNAREYINGKMIVHQV